MTVKELQELLCEYPDSSEVKFAEGRCITPNIEIKPYVNMETNQMEPVIFKK